ncbi:hypothetical protein Pla52o_26690 [Novipirellula galeiformis]|uniref:Uncharacterized protein n=1 Tax=Novipirellula galeiformis TaxID=2528004 RepID=A0A5C6CHY8_9BACT|nr:hypothetical protein Pla52o_26690 [Novipirellula galeiformis]
MASQNARRTASQALICLPILITCILSDPGHCEYHKGDGFLGGFGIPIVDLRSLHFETHQSERTSEGV